MGNFQFLTLVMHLACTETRVLLDDYKDEDDIKRIEFKNEDEKSKLENKQKRIQEILPICFEIIEFMISILVQYSEYDNEESIIKDNVIYNTLKNNNINSKWILSFREALSETILALMEFITEKEIYKDTQNIKKIDNMIVLLSTKVLSSWLSEDIEMYKKEIKFVIPALIEIVKIRPKSIDFMPINNISLVFSEITSNEEYQEIFINEGGIKTLLFFMDNNNITLNDITVLNILITLINIVMLNPDHIKSNKTQWKKIIKYYNKYSYTKVIGLSVIRLINSECNTKEEKQ
ncbi:hypothetical protein PIROE2DRAFT_4126 [Piromyces sp. E2]|nr:hypothetical protein PIROE2DRAFT_4126 [Piromyces sp. E2]|eukprot:OUM68246.1 hypothetical protein PIROE2DRAFT_4126 [Piromyces sp. E2]